MSTKTEDNQIRGAIALLFLASICCACVETDTTRVVGFRGTLGEEVYKVACQRVASGDLPNDVTGRGTAELCEGAVGSDAAPSARLWALAEQRGRFVDAVDRAIPESQHDLMREFLVQLLPLYDPPERTIPEQMRATADFLEKLADNPDTLSILERVSVRRGYRPRRHSLGALRPLVTYGDFDALSDTTLAAIDEDGVAGTEWQAFLRALALEMATAEAGKSSDDDFTAIRDLLLTEDEGFAVGGARYVVRRDSRGLAVPARPGAGLPEPFVDGDGDGLADVDNLGRFLGRDGSPLALPAPFSIYGEVGIARDASDRALRGDGTRYFNYVDGNRTLLAGLMRESARLLEPPDPLALDLLFGLPLLLGPAQTQTATYGAYSLTYRGFDTDHGAAFDLVHAMGAVLYEPEIDDVLAANETLLRDHENEIAALLDAVLFIDRQSDSYPDANLESPSNLWDDVIELLGRFAENPGMIEAMLRAFADPRVASLGPIFGDFMRFKDRITYNPADINGRPLGAPLDEPVDRSAPDSFDNESLWQRTQTLINALAGVEVCNKAGASLNAAGLGVDISVGNFGACELFRIDDAAEAFALAILGRYELVLRSGLLNFLINVGGVLGINVDSVLEQLSGIDGLTRHPTPEALARLVFMDPANSFVSNLIDPVIGKDGEVVKERHPGTIFAWELPGFYDGMAPLIEVFADPRFDRDASGRYAFTEFMGVFHRHWSSRASSRTQRDDPRAPFFAYQSNARSFEPLIADAFIDAELIGRLHRATVALDSVEVRPDVDGIDALAATIELMVDARRHRGLTGRDGRTMATVNDGSHQVPLTPIYLMLDALDAMDDALATDPDRQERFSRAQTELVQTFLRTRRVGTEFELESQRGRTILLTVLPYLRDRLAAHRAAGDIRAWSEGLHEDAAESLGAPLPAAFVNLTDAFLTDPESREALTALLHYMSSESSPNDAFDANLITAIDMLQLMEDDATFVPLLPSLAEAVAPNVNEAVASGVPLELRGSLLDANVAFVRDVAAVDTGNATPSLLSNLMSLPASGVGETPLEVIGDVIAEVNRVEPGTNASLSAADYQNIFRETIGFMRDEHRGMERLFLLIENRTLHASP